MIDYQAEAESLVASCQVSAQPNDELDALELKWRAQLVKHIAAALQQAEQRGWTAALNKVAQDFHDSYDNLGLIGVVEVRAFLDSRHVHYPECRARGKGER